MKFGDYVAKLNEFLAKNPEVEDFEVVNMSCFDSPSMYATSGVYVGDAYEVEDIGLFSNEDSANEALEENGIEDGYIHSQVVVLEAF